MKAINTLAGLALAAYAVLVLGACSQTSNGSNPAPATVAATTCVYGQPCTGGTTVCPSNGYYNGANGAYTPCTPGQVISGTGTGYYPPSNGYPYSSYPTAGTGCSSYYAQYGVQYVPIYLNGQLVCANYNALIQSMQQTAPAYYSYYQSTPYYQDPSYYYAYPPYSGGGGCGTSFAFSIGGVSAGLCF